LIKRVSSLCDHDKLNYKGMRVYAVDKSTLALPESPELWKEFGCHKSCHGLGNISAEICTVFDVHWRVPISWNVLKATSSELRLIGPLITKLKKHSLLLLDNGFYSLELFEKIIARNSHFIIPAGTALRPTVIDQLGPGDYLCEIESYSSKGKRLKKADRKKITVRVIYVQRNGFPRRRLVTSMLDPVQYPAHEIAEIYHQRWHVETFYRDFKIQMEGNLWHCKRLDTFYKELLSKFILITLTRIAMAEAAKKRRIEPGRLSFAKAFSCTKVFLFRVTQGHRTVRELYKDLVKEISENEIHSKSGRSYPRDNQERRRKSRGLERKKVGRPRTKLQRLTKDLTEILNGRLIA